MGIIKQGILGGFSKKVGSVVGTSWKGVAVMKSMPQSVVNPKTTLQVNQRNAFRDTAKIASLLLTPTIQECWNRWSKRMSGYNAFIKANVEIMKTFGDNITTFLAYMTLSNGELTLSGLAGSVNTSGTTQTITASWNGSVLGGRYDKATDIVKMGLIILPKVGEGYDLEQASVVMAEGVARTAGEVSMTFDNPDDDKIAFPFLYAISADGYFRSENLNFYTKIS